MRVGRCPASARKHLEGGTGTVLGPRPSLGRDSVFVPYRIQCEGPPFSSHSRLRIGYSLPRRASILPVNCQINRCPMSPCQSALGSQCDHASGKRPVWQRCPHTKRFVLGSWLRGNGCGGLSKRTDRPRRVSMAPMQKKPSCISPAQSQPNLCSHSTCGHGVSNQSCDCRTCRASESSVDPN